jgi:hypothetical protein
VSSDQIVILFLTSSMHVTCPAHLMRLDFLFLIRNNKPDLVNLMPVDLTTEVIVSVMSQKAEPFHVIYPAY